MSKQLVPDTAVFQLVHRFDDGQTQRQWQTSVYLNNDGFAWDGAHLAASAAAIGDAWEAEIVPLLNENVTFLRVDYNDLGADPGVSGFYNVDTPGAVTGDAMPMGTTVVVTLYGDSGALPAQGQWHLSGWSESQQDGGIWTSAFLTSLNTAISDFLAAADGGFTGDAVVIVSRAAGTDAELEAVRDAREALAAAIAATRRSEGIANTLGSPSHAQRAAVGSQRKRNQPNTFS